MLEEKDIQKLKEIFVTKDYLDEKLKNFSTKDDLNNLELKIDTKLNDEFYHIKQMFLAMQSDINEKFNSVVKMNTEDLVAVSGKEEKLEKRVNKLEFKVNNIQTKFA